MRLYVRCATAPESKTLSPWLHQCKNAVQVRRAQVLALSAEGMRGRQIAAQQENKQDVQERQSFGIRFLRARKALLSVK